MCHDLSFTANSVEFITDLLPNIVLDVQIDFDFSTTEHVLSMSHRKAIVVYSRDNTPHLNLFAWGLIADYMNTPEKIKQYRIQMANARSEKIFDKQSAWYKIKHQRCLIVVNGFYEHREISGWKNKVPYFIKLANRSSFFLLGLYNYSPIPDLETGEQKGTFTILTRQANELMKLIHNHGPNKHRMPVLLEPEEAIKWIKEDLSDEDMKNMLDYAIPDVELEAHPVFSLRTTKPRPDGRGKNDYFEWANLPPLGSDGIVQGTLL